VFQCCRIDPTLATYRETFERTLHEVDLALLVREMREDAGLTQTELARKVRTTQSVIARLEDAEYTGHSLTMLERIATACGVALKLHAEKKPNFDCEVALVWKPRTRLAIDISAVRITGGKSQKSPHSTSKANCSRIYSVNDARGSRLC
jgi:transcriptional regulator with XRE-family HTH domain